MDKTSLPKSVLKFLVSGVVGVGLGFLTLYVLTEFFGVWYMLSAVIAFIFNYTSNFIFHKFWTFRGESGGKAHVQAFLYATLALALFFSGMFMLYVQVEWLHVWYLAAQVINTFILTIVSFVFTRRILTS